MRTPSYHNPATKSLAHANQETGTLLLKREAVPVYNQASGNLQGMADQYLASRQGISSAGTVQAYKDLSKGPIWGYGKGGGAHTPNFEFQKARVTKTPNNTQSTMTYGISSEQVIEDAPKLKVSDNNDMAVPTSEGAEAKRFFATPGIINASNHALNLAGAPLRLIAEGGQITLPNGLIPFGPTLSQVRPDLSQVQNESSACDSFVRGILGVDTSVLELQTILGQHQVDVSVPKTRDQAINNALNGDSPESLGGNKNTNPEVGEAFGIFARKTLPKASTLFMKALNGVTAVKDWLTTKKSHLQWGEHWAGVVAKSGSDYVTLENYNRITADGDLILQELEKDYESLKGLGKIQDYRDSTSQYEAKANEYRIQRLIRLKGDYMKYAIKFGQVVGHYQDESDRWYFAMYGSEKQSFHEAWKNSAPNGVTAKVT